MSTLNKCRALDIKSLFFPILFPLFKLSLMMSESWNKRVGSSLSYIGPVWMMKVYMEEYVIGLVMRSLGYQNTLILVSLPPSRYLYTLWKWIEEWIKDWKVYCCDKHLFWRNRTCILDLIRNITCILDRFCIFDHVDVCVLMDSSSGNMCSETFILYAKWRKEIYGRRGFLDLLEFCGWDWCWLCFGYSKNCTSYEHGKDLYFCGQFIFQVVYSSSE